MHLKRLNTPKRWNVEKKITKFISRPSCGPHPKSLCVPLVVLLRDHLKIISTKKECKRLINQRLILVDNSVVSDVDFPIGLFDVIALPSFNLYYRIVLDYKGGIIPISINKEESLIKPFSILNKKRMKKSIIQLNCTSGRNIITKKDVYKTGDTLVLNLDNKKITKHLPVKKGFTVLVIQGKHMGEVAEIQGLKEFESIGKDRVILKNEKGVVYETMKDYVFVVGEKKVEFKISEAKK